MNKIQSNLSLRGATPFVATKQSLPAIKAPLILRILFFTILLFAAVACTAPTTQATPTPEEIAKNYRSWTAMFETFQTIGFQLMLMCRLMTDQERAYLESEHGHAYVQVYANPVAEAVMRLEGKRTFPQGSVIVKEKLAENPELTNASTSVKPTGLGIMVKRAPGFDAVGRDWEYLYVDESGTITRDQKQLEHCRACHMANEEQDAIFYPKLFEN